MIKKNNNKIKVCYLLSYRAPNYTRTATLLAALQQVPNIELTVIKNSRTGLTRYLQTLVGLIKYRRREKPDVFILGFRGQEVFGPYYPFMRGSKIIFDEFINMHDWFVSEQKRLKDGSWAMKSLDAYMRWAVKKSNYVLTDTAAHAELSAAMYDVPLNKFVPIPVGAEEGVFKPVKDRTTGSSFEVFFYGNILPLHGLEVILDSIKLLEHSGRINNIHFTLVGGRGKPKMTRMIKTFMIENKLQDHVIHLPWVDYHELPDYVAKADLCLGGPFGGTGQAGRVVTGKTYQFMAMAKPTVVGEGGNTKDFVNRDNCLMVKQGSPEELTDAIAWGVQNKKKLKLIGNNGRKLFEERFSSLATSRTLEKLLRN